MGRLEGFEVTGASVGVWEGTFVIGASVGESDGLAFTSDELSEIIVGSFVFGVI